MLAKGASLPAELLWPWLLHFSHKNSLLLTESICTSSSTRISIPLCILFLVTDLDKLLVSTLLFSRASLLCVGNIFTSKYWFSYLSISLKVLYFSIMEKDEFKFLSCLLHHGSFCLFFSEWNTVLSVSMAARAFPYLCSYHHCMAESNPVVWMCPLGWSAQKISIN